MKIIVKSLQGDEFILDVQNDQLVSDLKLRISEKPNGPAARRQKLVFKGRTMQDDSRLNEYNLEADCKVHLIIRKEDAAAPTSAPSSSCPTDANSRLQCPVGEDQAAARNKAPQSRFEVILRERLAEHFAPDSVEKIMANLQKEINADVNSSSLDDLERLAKQKLNISNE